MPKTIRICKLPGCENAAAWKRRYCSDACQFWPRVDRSGGPGACWLWQGHVNPRNGYGQVTSDETAHRRAYRLQYGDPGNMCVLHECDTRLCSNPAHLFLGTRKTNWLDSIIKRRQKMIVFGEANVRSKLTTADVLAIRQSPQNDDALAQHYGVESRTIHEARSRGSWRHIPDIQIDGDPEDWVFVTGVMDRQTPTTQQESNRNGN